MADKHREEFSNGYEFRRELLYKDIWDKDDIKGGKIINYFIPSSGVEVSGKVFTPPLTVFEIEIDINKCLTVLKDKFLTKGGKLRASMENLKEWEIIAWSELLNYVWLEKRDGIESKVLLSKKEYGMLFMDNKSVSKSKTTNKKK